MPSLRHIAVLMSLVSLFLCSQGGLVVHGFFHLQQGHIANHHCENRFKPEMKCNGRCFLQNRIEEADQRQHEHQAVAAVPVLFYIPAVTSPAMVRLEAPARPYAQFEEQRAQPGVERDVDRPPRKS